METNLEKRVSVLEKLHAWGGFVIGIAVFWYVLKKYNENGFK
jgi:hypothetical protein